MVDWFNIFCTIYSAMEVRRVSVRIDVEELFIIGQWDMLVNLVNKYGVVPKGAFPESSSSEAALQMNKFLRSKVNLI